jgi:hypothetical protein
MLRAWGYSGLFPAKEKTAVEMAFRERILECGRDDALSLG